MGKDDFILDGFGSLEAGINSGLLPQLLENNQAAFATNTTFRGGYARPRPPVRKMILNFSGSQSLQTNSTKRLFQGAAFYNPDYGPESLVTSIGGLQFQFTPDAGNGAVVTDISIPGDPNPATPQIVWIWQSEKWSIFQDGQSVPIFYDGTVSRRSQSLQRILGVVAAPGFTAPAIGAIVIIPLNPPGFQGQIGDVFFIETSGVSYQATYPAATPNATVTNLVDSAVNHIVGEQVIVNPNILGCQATNLTLGANGTFTPNTLLVTLTLTQPYMGALGVNVVFLGKIWQIISKSGNFILIKNTQTITVANNLIPAGTQIPFSATSFPITILGTLALAFVVPGIGASVDIVMSTPYTGTNGQVVFIGSGQYTIDQKAPPPPGLALTAININDTAGNVTAAGKKLLSVPEIPTGRMGTYGIGRNWLSLPDGLRFIASDIVAGTSGTPANNFRDAVLKTTENLFLAGGGFFTIPSSGDQITAMRFATTLDASLGQGPLQVGTQHTMFSCQAPVDRTDWQTITNPILTISLQGQGPLGQNSTISINSDIGFRSTFGIASLILARREFATWGNTPQSREVERVIAQDNIDLLQFGSAIEFDNRWLQTALPTQGALGVYHRGLIALNLDPISTLRGKAPSIYDGFWTGLNVLQLVNGQFNGVERAFAFCYNSFNNEIELWELLPTTDNNLFDNGTTPITWSFETAALFKNIKGKGAFDLLQLLDGEIYISDLVGPAHIHAWYRAENDPCWHEWIEFDVCAAANEPRQYRSRLGLGKPDIKDCDATNNRPASFGNNFQVRFEFTGSFKFMGGLFKSVRAPETTFSVPICDKLCIDVEVETELCEPCKTVGTCIAFPLVSYDLNDQRGYTNPLLSFDIECRGGQHVTVYVQAGTVNFSYPFPAGLDSYPPAIMGCLAGGSIVRTIPAKATQAEIDAIINGMILQCAQAYAQSLADCPTALFSNDQVIFQMSCAEGEIISFTGTLPAWITLDTTTNQLIGVAGVIQAASVAEATALAQAQLDTWANEQIGLGNLTCGSALTFLALKDDEVTNVLTSCLRYVMAVGVNAYINDNGSIWTSSDGLNWVFLSSPGYIQSVFFANAVFVTGGFGGGLWTSPDAINWTARTSNTANEIYRFAFGSARFVGVCFSGDTIVSADNGATWTENASGTGNDLKGIAFGAGLFVTVGVGGVIYTSADGTTWSVQVSSTAEDLNDVVFAGGQFVAVGSNGTILTSVNGILWAAQVSGTSANYVGITFGASLYVACAGDSTDLLTSTDGIVWNTVSKPSFSQFVSVTFLSAQTFLIADCIVT